MLLTLVICSHIGLMADPPGATEEVEDPFTKELLSLDWQFTGTHKLPTSHSTLSIPEGYIAVTGNDAVKFSILSDNNPEDIEAVVLSDSDDMIVFKNHEEGYVAIDDWKNLDKKALLESISENTKKANLKRRQNGNPELHVIGWLQEPTLDRNTNTVYWAIETKSEGQSEHDFNSIALRLGRKGYERVIWVGSMPKYKAFGGELDVMLRAHSFDSGYRYNDYTIGDKVAAYGVTTLVAATAGAKIAKAGGFAALAVLLKKFGGFIAAGVGALFCAKGRSKNEGDANG